ncbi:MAG: tetrahydromethanopterin S-methyltransferase subunit A [Pseudomonadota bacterium]
MKNLSSWLTKREFLKFFARATVALGIFHLPFGYAKALYAKTLKVKPPENYPPEEGCYLRGDDLSPVAVAVLLPFPYGTDPPKVEAIPPEIEKLVKMAIETGAALSGTLQTENIGIEKIICNIVANTNIRYLVLCGKELETHFTGNALIALFKNGVNEKRTIVGAKGARPYLFNIPPVSVERFREQVTLVNLFGVVDPGTIEKAVWSCRQEKPIKFLDYTLSDPGVYPKPAISKKLELKVPKPYTIEEFELEDIVRELKKEK